MANRSMPERSTGRVKWYNSAKGYGFIIPDNGGGEDLFFIRPSIVKSGQKCVSEDEPVDFIIERKDDGRMTAVDVDTRDDNFSPGVECYACGDIGHISRNCPDLPLFFCNKGQRCCYECGEDGHFARDCPTGRSVKQMKKMVLVEEATLLSEKEDARKSWEIKSTEKEYKLRFDMPGMIRNDVKVWVEEKVLLFKVEKALKKKKAGESIKVEDEEEWSADSYGKYGNRIKFPEDVVFEEIKAEVRDGVLYITVPKAGTKKILNIDVL